MEPQVGMVLDIDYASIALGKTDGYRWMAVGRTSMKIWKEGKVIFWHIGISSYMENEFT